MQIFLINFVIILNFYTIGILFLKNLEFHNFLNKFSLSCVFGAIFVSFLALLINFFLPLDKLVGNTFIILSFVFFLVIFYSEKNKIDLIKFTFLSSLIATILILYSTINRPDSGLYHLPYIQLINEHKILLGISNIHFRFGHISIIQYLSAIYNNSFFPIEVIVLPSAIITGSIFLYFFSFLDRKYNFLELKIFVSLITIYSLYSFNRYSGFGNDATSHLLLFLVSIFFLQNQFQIKNIDYFATTTLISIFIFMQKTFMIFLPIICFFVYLFFLVKINIYKNLKILFSIIFILLWIIKNVMISGCLVFPISILCFDSLSYVNIDLIKNFEILSESWSKDWPNRTDQAIKMSTFNESFNWFQIWYNNHFNFIIKKFSPFILLLSLILIYGISFSKNFKRENNTLFIKKNYLILVLIFLFCIIWFLKFPLYRYGQSFLASTCISIFTLCFIHFTNVKKIKGILIATTIFITFIAVSKNFLRIYQKYEIRNQWPNIYTLSEMKKDNFKKKLIPIKNNNVFIYYFSESGECMYNLSPCSNFLISRINKKNINNYEIFYIEN